MDSAVTREILKKVRQVELRTRRLVTDALSGEYHSVFKGRGMDFDEVREYTPGDEVRLIDWNVTARTGTPFIKKLREERELTILLAVDVSASGKFGSQARRASASSPRRWPASSPSPPSATATRSACFSSAMKSSSSSRRPKAASTCCASSARFSFPHAATPWHRCRRRARFHQRCPAPPRGGLCHLRFHRDARGLRSVFGCNCASPINATISSCCHLRDRHEEELPALGLLTLEDTETGEVHGDRYR